MTERIVDAHFHLRDPTNHPYEQLSDGVSEDGERGGTEAQPYLPAAYFDDLAGLDVVGLVHIEAEWLKTETTGESKWLASLGDTGMLRKLPFATVGFADLSRADVAATLAGHAAFPRVRGIRHILNYLPGNPALCWADRNYLQDLQWHKGFAELANYGLDFDLMCFPHQLSDMAQVAAKHPKTTIHLEHAGMPHDHSEDGRKLWHEGMQKLAAQPNTDVKISGFGNTIPEWTTEKIRAYVLDTIEIFGIERVCFASNSPTDKQFSSIRQIWDAFFDITQHFTSDEREAMFVQNVLRLYRV